MARTHGHGNPDWTRDETILALALYLETGEAVPSKKDPRVQRLSSTLRALPYHAEAARRETFRNPDGVAFKLQKLRSVATGKGLGNTSTMDREIWRSLGGSLSASKNWRWRSKRRSRFSIKSLSALTKMRTVKRSSLRGGS